MILRNGLVYDGSEGPPRIADVGIQGDRIAAIGDLGSTTSQVQINVEGLVNVTEKVSLPSMAFGSDADSMATEGVSLKSSTHPRAYGNFARLLGKYVCDEGATPLGAVIRPPTSFPAENLTLDARGRLEIGYCADVVVLDPETIHDHATYDEPHQYPIGMEHVFVNGVAVFEDGEYTGAFPGRFVHEPGYQQAQ